MARARRSGAPLHLALLDVDHFKLFNDTNGQAPEELIGRADDALYQAKHQGRDRVVATPPPAPQPGGDRSPRSVHTS